MKINIYYIAQQARDYSEGAIVCSRGCSGQDHAYLTIGMTEYEVISVICLR